MSSDSDQYTEFIENKFLISVYSKTDEKRNLSMEELFLKSLFKKI